MLRLVGVDGRALACAAPPLRADREVVLAACASRGVAILHAAEALQGDRDVVLAALTCAAPGRPVDPDLVLDEDSGCGAAFRGDRELVLAATLVNGEALAYATDELKADKGLVLAAAAKGDRYALARADDALKADPDFVKEVLGVAPGALEFVAEALKNDRDIVLAAVAASGSALRLASDALRADRGLVAAAVAQAPLALRFAADALQADAELAALRDAAVAAEVDAFTAAVEQDDGVRRVNDLLQAHVDACADRRCVELAPMFTGAVVHGWGEDTHRLEIYTEFTLKDCCTRSACPVGQAMNALVSDRWNTRKGRKKKGGRK